MGDFNQIIVYEKIILHKSVLYSDEHPDASNYFRLFHKRRYKYIGKQLFVICIIFFFSVSKLSLLNLVEDTKAQLKRIAA